MFTHLSGMSFILQYFQAEPFLFFFFWGRKIFRQNLLFEGSNITLAFEARLSYTIYYAQKIPQLWL